MDYAKGSSQGRCGYIVAHNNTMGRGVGCAGVG